MSDPYSLSEPLPLVPGTHGPRAFALDSWASLRVGGADAETFLQGQLSADLRALTPERAAWASYNSPKGRMLAVMSMVRDGDGIDLRMPKALLEPVSRRLRMFVLRSKVSLALREPRATDAGTQIRDRTSLIEAGIPVVYLETQDRWVAQMANLDLLGGISFDKGCYTGQEVVARLHYLGNLKKRMFLVRGSGSAPAPGTSIHDAEGDGQAVGDVVDAVASDEGFVASAVLQVAASAKATLVLDRSEDAALSQPETYRY